MTGRATRAKRKRKDRGRILAGRALPSIEELSMAVSYSGNVFRYKPDERVSADNKEKRRRLGGWDGMV